MPGKHRVHLELGFPMSQRPPFHFFCAGVEDGIQLLDPQFTIWSCEKMNPQVNSHVPTVKVPRVMIPTVALLAWEFPDLTR